ncbi:hypothetical protein Slin_3054 [Spirosoma linguale DSM 74]|uniref:Uncharacterized protein n=1 Tax=Spirosoma linguale (strain ATCC 33905 / DSM 74 / LMG 10896 / Claus 1) TaxID=504472 RepID=D2QLB8_SPILD|nr:hypothetical protein Slin_3054 [Spirosoma linguale DSM 74]
MGVMGGLPATGSTSYKGSFGICPVSLNLIERMLEKIGASLELHVTQIALSRAKSF